MIVCIPQKPENSKALAHNRDIKLQQYQVSKVKVTSFSWEKLLMIAHCAGTAKVFAKHKNG